MADWGGAQWVLVTWLTLEVIVPPLLRFGMMMDGSYRPKNSNAEFIGRRVADLTGKLVLVAILYWGGFW